MADSKPVRGKCQVQTSDEIQCKFTAKTRLKDGTPSCNRHQRMIEEGVRQGSKRPKCSGVRKGSRCTFFARTGSEFCANHEPDPKVRAEAQREIRLRGVTQNKRMLELLNGKLDVSTLDDEELARGQFKDKNGRFSGQPPKVLPRVVYQRLTKELFRRADVKLQQSLLDAVETMVNIATSEYAENKDKIKAATWIFERLRGKVPETISITQERPFEILLQGIVAGDRTAPKSLESYVDAEIVEDDEEEDDGLV